MSASYQFTLDILKEPEASLENFVESKVSHSSVSILQTLRSAIDLLGTRSPLPEELRSMYLWGPEGSGKTHLLRALVVQNPTLLAVYFSPTSTSWAELDYGKGLSSNLYLFDDVDRYSDSQLEDLFRAMIELKEFDSKCIIVTGNQSIKGLPIREDVQSRLAAGLNFELKLLTDEEKLLALESVCQSRGIQISNEVFPWLMHHFYRDLPSLMSMIEALDQYSLETKRAITLPLVRELLQFKNP